MGGRGSSTGVSDHGIPYGREYHSLLTVGNIKFIVQLDNRGLSSKAKKDSITTPMETMTKNRVYVTLSVEGDPKSISYYDKNNKRKKQIDINQSHHGISPPTHHGYYHNEYDSPKGCAHLTSKEKAMVDRVTKIWEERKNDVWTRWKALTISAELG